MKSERSGPEAPGRDLLVVLCGQVDAVLLASGGQVTLQTLDLLCIFLGGGNKSQIIIILSD